MKLFDKLFGRKKPEETSEPINYIFENRNEERVELDFNEKTIDIKSYPFELMINMMFNDAETHGDFDWLWMITIKSMDNDELGLPTKSERKKLSKFFQDIIQTILKESDIKIVGTSIHKGQIEIMFYARKEDTKSVGGTIADMPSYMQDIEGRFVSFNAKEDSNWGKVLPFYHLCNQ